MYEENKKELEEINDCLSKYFAVNGSTLKAVKEQRQYEFKRFLLHGLFTPLR